jgi:hypothetical protein
VRYVSILVTALAAASVATPAAAVTPSPQSTGKALILVPLTLAKIDDLSFGSVVPSGMSGVVTINASSGARSFAGGVTGVPGDPGNRALFGGAGTPNQQVFVSMTYPAQLASSGGDTIDVLALTMDGPATRTINPVTRAFFVGVGGTLMIAADQPEGIYQANFDVTANYQ